MFKLSPTLVKQEYLLNQGLQCKLGTATVFVTAHYTHTQTGSWMHGWKFHTSKYALLIRTRAGAAEEFSMDHGATWWRTSALAARQVGKNRVLLTRDTRKEFAYDAIQVMRERYGY